MNEKSLRSNRQRRKAAQEAIAFAGVGLSNTAIGYLVFAILWSLLGNQWHYLSILGATYGIVMAVGFVLYRELVFRSSTSWPLAVVKYVVIVAGSVAINSVILIVLVEHVMLPVLASQAIAIFFAAGFSYLGHKYWTFRDSSKRSGFRFGSANYGGVKFAEEPSPRQQPSTSSQ